MYRSNTSREQQTRAQAQAEAQRHAETLRALDQQHAATLRALEQQAHRQPRAAHGHDAGLGSLDRTHRAGPSVTRERQRPTWSMSLMQIVADDQGEVRVEYLADLVRLLPPPPRRSSGC